MVNETVPYPPADPIHLATLRLKEIDIFNGSLLVAAYPLRCMGDYGGVYGLWKFVEKELSLTQ